MSQAMTRNPGQSRKSNTQGPASSGYIAAGGVPEPVQFYENDTPYGTPYVTTGQQEWIYMPDDTFPVGIVLSGSGSWAASVIATDSPPDVVAAGNAITYTWPQGTVSATTNSTIQGATAIAVYVTTVGTNVKISVRS